MAAEECSLGVDLGSSPWPVALAHDGAVEVLTPQPDTASLAEHLLARGVHVSVVVLASPQVHQHGEEGLALELAQHLGIEVQRVSVVDRSGAATLGKDHSGVSEPAAAIGAALTGLNPAAAAARLNSLAAGAAGGLIGGLGAAAFTGPASTSAVAAAAGPAGVPMSTTAVGPAGVPLAPGVGAGSAGVPFSQGTAQGPGGVPIGGGTATGAPGVPFGTGPAAGPGGVSITGPAKVARRGRTIVVVAAAVAVVAAVAVGAVATSGDDAASGIDTRAPADVTATSLAAVLPDTVPDAAAGGSPDASGLPGSTTELAGAACTVGSWLADNETFGTVFIGLAGGSVAEVAVTGEVRVDVASDGTVLTTFTDFSVTGTMPSIGTVEVAESGTETSTIVFADDGSYTVTSSQIQSTQVVSSNGVVFQSGPSPAAVFTGTGTFTCAGDQLDVTIPGDLGDFVETFHRRA